MSGKIPSQPPQTSAQKNAAAGRAILAQGVERLQSLGAKSYNPASQTIVNIVPQNVGLIRGFLVKVSGIITNTSATAIGLTRTNLGAANLLKNISFTDTNNQNRHASQGWHMHIINSAKQPLVFGAAYAPNIPVGWGNNVEVMSAPSTIAQNIDAPVQFMYYVPLSMGKYDLRGAMWAGVVNAVAQLQLEINPNPVVAAPGDGTLAVYSGAAGALGGWKVGSAVTIEVFQDYIDQIPQDNNGMPVLPQEDMQMLYQLQVTNMTGFVPGQDYGLPYGNFRNFLSTVVGYDQAGVLNPGTDINYFALQTANSSNIWKYSPEEAALLARSTFMADPPSGFYYFDSRAKPISTQQFGNTQITLNPLTAAAGTNALLAWEFTAQASQVVFAGSLPSGG